ncbi:hypothetical protein NM688_g7317 [Phlebia brevispora]|uniref:Uncharacterized protein n=1 Tax=Phlebia brevispora TaxID=194682 RepID=A0ACC1S6S2_9APHY|nr:hypothetical protein NM688_g7317 [Phlebia brevispora]
MSSQLTTLIPVLDGANWQRHGHYPASINQMTSVDNIDADQISQSIINAWNQKALCKGPTIANVMKWKKGNHDPNFQQQQQHHNRQQQQQQGQQQQSNGHQGQKTHRGNCSGGKRKAGNTANAATTSRTSGMDFTFMATVPSLLSHIEGEHPMVADNNYPRMQAAISLARELEVPATAERIRALEEVVEAESSEHTAKRQKLMDHIIEKYKQAESPVSLDFSDFNDSELMELAGIWQVDKLRVFGSDAWVHIPADVLKDKLEPKSELMVYLGNTSYGWKFMRSSNNIVFTLSQAIFNESVFLKCDPKHKHCVRDTPPIPPHDDHSHHNSPDDDDDDLPPSNHHHSYLRHCPQMRSEPQLDPVELAAGPVLRSDPPPAAMEDSSEEPPTCRSTHQRNVLCQPGNVYGELRAPTRIECKTCNFAKWKL